MAANTRVPKRSVLTIRLRKARRPRDYVGKNMRKIIIIAVLACVCSILATPYWDFETHREARRRIEALESQARLRSTEMPPWQVYPRFSYPHELVELAEFWRIWQLVDVDSIEHGGIIEAESGDLREVIQTDNTQEVVWNWAFYTARSGDSTYLENIDSAWVYLGNFPAYLEEISDLGGGHTSYYYRVWNSALGLLMTMGLRDNLGDYHHGYADSCVDVLMNNRLSMDTPWPEIDGLHALVNSFAAGCLYKYGMEYTCLEYCDTAVSIACAVQEWIDEDTAARMDYVDWAMSSGTILWGMVNSRFAAFPDSLDAWLSTYGVYIPDRFPAPDDYDPLIWDNSWNIWLANGFRAVWHATGDSSYYIEYREILDELLAQDRDGDGGIPASAAGPDYEDMTWISAYLLLYAMDWVIDSLPELDVGALNPTVYMPKGFATMDDTVYVVAQAAAFGDGAAGDVDFSVYFDWGVLLDTTANLGWGEVCPADTFAITPGAEGTHVIEVHTYLADTEPWNDTARVEFEATAVRNVHGIVSGRDDFSPIEAELSFSLILGDSITPFDNAIADTTGYYELDLPCLSFKIEIDPEFPYWREILDSVWIDPFIDNQLDIQLDRADLVIVDDDTGATYEDYYLFAFDTIGATYRLWDRDSIGSVPPEVGGEMRRHTVLWFTGDDSTNTLDSADIAALQYIVDNGGYVILTGQGLCEDLAGNPAFDSLVHCTWLGGDGLPVLYGVPGDEVSDSFGIVVTFGGGSAANQTHRDRLEPIFPAVGWLMYSDSSFGAIRYEDPISGGKIVFLGFGIEGVVYPGANPSYTDRVELLESILKWFDPTYEIAEIKLPSALKLRAYPNPFNSTVKIRVSGLGFRVSGIEIYDIGGRRIAPVTELVEVPGGEKLPSTGSGSGIREFIWRPDRAIPSGVYLVKTIGCDDYLKLIFIR